MLSDVSAQFVSVKSVFDAVLPVAAVVVTVFLAMCGVFAFFFKRLIDQVDGISKELKPIRPAIIELQNLITSTSKPEKIMFPLTVEPGSPLKVTDYGESLLKESGFYDVMAKNATALVESVKAKNPRTNYDIQESSFEVIRELLETADNLLVPLKKYVFNSGMEIEVLVPPAAITLRDEVMKTLRFEN